MSSVEKPALCTVLGTARTRGEEWRGRMGIRVKAKRCRLVHGIWRMKMRLKSW